MNYIQSHGAANDHAGAGHTAYTPEHDLREDVHTEYKYRNGQCVSVRIFSGSIYMLQDRREWIQA